MPAHHTVLHLGVGSFHRAHQAVYMQRLQQLRDEDAWSLVGGNIRPGMEETIEALKVQKGHYTLETVSPQGNRSYERITAIDHVIPYEPHLRDLIDVGASTNTRIISFTVTESGYYLNASGGLNTTHPDIRSDLIAFHANAPKQTIYGALTAILTERRRRGSGPITLLSCDNVRHNGSSFRCCFLQFLNALGETSLESWVIVNTRSPNTVVDRITPRPDTKLQARVISLGWNDAAPVMAENYLQWVLEDNFVAGRPSWHRVGAMLVDSATPYEEAKIRILNGSHSGIAWAAYLTGYRYIHEAMRDERIRRLVFDYVDGDVIPCLQPSPIDLASYRDMVFKRFSSESTVDTVERVTTDSYAKLRGFVAPTLADRLMKQQRPAHAARIVALFLKAVLNVPRDLLNHFANGAAEFKALEELAKSNQPVELLCSDSMLWGDFAENAALIAIVQEAFDKNSDCFDT